MPIEGIFSIQSVIAVVFFGVLEKARLGRWGHAMAEARGQQEESARHDGGHVDVIVALTHFAPPTLHINITAHIYMELHEKVSRLGSCILLFTKGFLMVLYSVLSLDRYQLLPSFANYCCFMHCCYSKVNFAAICVYPFRGSN